MTRAASRESKSRLKFDKSIISTLKSPISTKELLIRLQALSDELSAVDQDNVDIGSYKKIQDDLVNKKLLGNSNFGIQAYVCCCLSDILRINAPNAPFTATQLSDIFKAFFKQFKKLAEQENPYFQQQCYLLKRLAEVRSVILITDLPDAEQLIDLIFTTFYDLSAKEFPSRLEPLTCDILSEIISESESIPHKVLKLILDKFLSPTTEGSAITAGSRSNISNSGFNFSMHICESNLDRMSRQVAQYFSEMLYESSNQVQANNESALNTEGENSKTLESLAKIHKLSIQIWRYIPELLDSVIGLLDDELSADDENIRILATETIGKMIGSPAIISSTVTSKVNFFVKHKGTWANWLKRTIDISGNVRTKWVQQYSLIMANVSSTTEINIALNGCLYKCLLDTDEKVRTAACESIARVPFESFTNKVCNKNILETLAHLTREKNGTIRNLAVKIFGTLYDNFYNARASKKVINFGNHDEKESNELEEFITTTIPNLLLSLIYINDKNITSSIDLCIFEKLIPISEVNSINRVDRLLHFYNNLDDKGRQSFLAINKRQQQVSKVLQTFIEEAENFNKVPLNLENKENLNDGKSDDKHNVVMKLDKIIKWLSVSLPDGLNTYSCLERFYKLNRNRFYYLVKVCISPESDYNTVRNSLKELLSKLGDSKNLKVESERNNISTVDMVTNMKILLLRGSVILYNKSNVVELINYSKDTNHKWYSVSNELLEHISLTVPDVFKFYIRELTNLIIDEPTDETDERVPKGLQLRTIYHFVKKFPEMFPSDFKFTEALRRLAVNGTPLEAKYSVKTLNLCEKKEIYCSSIVNSIYPLDLDHPKFATHLSAIAELFVVSPISIQDKAVDLTSLLIKEIFLNNRNINKEAVKNDNGWIEDDYLESHYQTHATLYEKLLAMRMLVNRLKGLANSGEILSDEEKDDIVSNAQPVFKLLMSFIGNSGEIINKKSASWPTPELYKLKIRSTAGLYLLKLAKYPIYSEMLHPTTLRRLTFLLTDTNEHVRAEFLVSLQKKLVNEVISERFLAIIFFTAIEPVTELKNNANMWIKSLFKRLKTSSSIKFEKSLVRIIHILAHHEQFNALMNAGEEDTKEESLLPAYTYALKFIAYFVSLVADQENISLLYYLASRVKQHRDATLDSSLYDKLPLPQEILNLYRVAELAQLIVKEYSDSRNWPLQTWPGKLKLPTDIYSPMASTSEAQGILTKIFIPESIQLAIRGPIRKKLMGVGSKRKAEPSTVSKPKKPRTKKPSVSYKLKTDKPKQALEPSRKSSRSTKKVSYVEDGSGPEASDSSDESE